MGTTSNTREFRCLLDVLHQACRCKAELYTNEMYTGNVTKEVLLRELQPSLVTNGENRSYDSLSNA